METTAAHLGSRFQGRLSLRNAALGCRYRHRAHDDHGRPITWTDDRPIMQHPRHTATDPPDQPQPAIEPESPPPKRE